MLGSHGVSVGSIAQYPGVYDIIQNIWVQVRQTHLTKSRAILKSLKNVTFGNGLDGTKSQNGVRIKSWPGGYGSGIGMSFILIFKAMY